MATGKHEAAWEIVGDCGYFIMIRPSYEALGWLDPALPINNGPTLWPKGSDGWAWLGSSMATHALRRVLGAVPPSTTRTSPCCPAVAARAVGPR